MRIGLNTLGVPCLITGLRQSKEHKNWSPIKFISLRRFFLNTATENVPIKK